MIDFDDGVISPDQVVGMQVGTSKDGLRSKDNR